MARFYLGYLRFMKGQIHGESEVIELSQEFARNLRVPIKVQSFAPIERPNSRYYSVLLTRSPHGQLATYSPTVHDRYRGRRYSEPVSELPLATSLQEQAIAGVKLNELSGSITLLMDEKSRVIATIPGLTYESLWTLDFTFVSHFENAVRGAHDLPLGNSELIRSDWTLLEYEAPQGLDMTRPYLHLFAHNPNYRIRQLTQERGVISVFGGNLREQIEHAVDYMESVITE